ncbi:MAG: hypothetical protein IJ783_04095 [Kiritimatiellae bacterium]|nr:hypothetical protein [Kiritimatiellia bacterium]
MKKILHVLQIFASHAAVAATVAIGNESFELDFGAASTNMAFRTFAAGDVSRVFAPVGNVSNVVDVASIMERPGESAALTFRERYPEGFLEGISATNRNGVLVFRMDESLARRYLEAYESFPAVSNRIAALDGLVASINDGTIVNQPDERILSLVAARPDSGLEISVPEIRAFFGDMSRSGPFSVSILDCETVDFNGSACPMAVAKAAVIEGDEVQFVPVPWIYMDGHWSFCHPALLER